MAGDRSSTHTVCVIRSALQYACVVRDGRKGFWLPLAYCTCSMLLINVFFGITDVDLPHRESTQSGKTMYKYCNKKTHAQSCFF